jgi:hypothetical protein
MVELCNSAETGVGPSMAEGSQGCSPNWADFPVAAIRQPSRKRDESKVVEFINKNRESKFQLEDRTSSVPADKSIPMSPTRL